MASLSSGLKLGSGSASSLVKSAQTMQNEIANQQDEAAKIEWENSAYTDSAFQSYSDYLNSRIGQLQASGSITNQTKALTMQEELITASHNNMSWQISQENQALLVSGEDGTSNGYQQKMDVVGKEIQRAQSIGDMTLANSLTTQYESLSQSYQNALQTQATAAQTTQSANNTAVKAGYTDAISHLKDGMSALFANIKNPLETSSGKPVTAKAALDAFVTQDAPLYKALGTPLPTGAQLTIGGVIKANFEAQLNYNINAAQSLGGSDPTAAANFAQFDNNGNIIGGEALKILDGTAYFDVPGLGNVNSRDAQVLAAQPQAIREESAGGVTKFAWNTVVGYGMVNVPDQNGKENLIPMPLYNGSSEPVKINKTGIQGVVQGVTQSLTSEQVVNQLKSAGFGNIKYNTSGKLAGSWTATLTAQTDKWMQYKGQQPDLSSGNGEIGYGNTVNFRLDPKLNGTLDAITSGGRFVSLAFDGNKNAGIFQTLPTGQTIALAGQYGFNERQNTLIANMTSESLQARTFNAAKGSKGINVLDNLLSNSLKALPGSFEANNPNAGGFHSSNFIGPKATMAQRAGGGFNFTQNGQAISAARYAQLMNTPFRTLLQTMANRGDAGARAALNFVGNDFGYDPTKIAGNSGLYNALTYGVMPNAGAKPAPTPVMTANSPVKLGGLSVK